MFKEFTRGDKILIQLNNKDVLSGVLVRNTPNRLDMKNLCDQDGVKLGGIMSFYTNEVISARLLSASINESELVTNKLNKSTKLSNGTGPEKLLIPEMEFERLKTMWQQYTYIHQKDKQYYDSCSDLIKAESIGVVGLGSSSGRNQRLSMLVLCTWQNCYIFDVSQCQCRSLYEELKEILESRFITKVVHDGRSLVDCLYHTHRVHMNNIFDTFIADIMIKKKNNGKSQANLKNISDCLIEYFSFPEYLLHGALNVTDSEWRKRPVDHEFKLKAAQLGTYLIILRDHLQAKLLEDYHNSVKLVYRTFTTLDAFSFGQQINNTQLTPELDRLIVGGTKDLSTNAMPSNEPKIAKSDNVNNT